MVHNSDNLLSTVGSSSGHSSYGAWVVAITGASGTVYARRLLQVIAQYLPQQQLAVVISDAAYRVMREEEGLSIGRGRAKISHLLGMDAPNITVHDNKDIGASIASGSYKTEGMIVVPCSMATLASISCGIASNLIHRAADVTIKEGRRLILVPRETPLSSIHLENMLKLSRLGITMLPAMPGFYHQPASISELVDMLVMRMLDHMGLSNKLELALNGRSLVDRWGDKTKVETMQGDLTFVDGNNVHKINNEGKCCVRRANT